MGLFPALSCHNTCSCTKALHYQFTDKLDTYTVIMFGYMISSTTSVGRDSYSSINALTHESYLLKGTEIAVRPLSSIIPDLSLLVRLK